MNKAQFIEALAGRLGSDKKSAGIYLDAVLDEIYLNVVKGDKVALTGFGAFEKRDRAARLARNPATGASVRVKKTSVPAFRAGAQFKAVVSGAKKIPKAPAAKKTPAKAAKTVATKTTAPASTTRATKAPAAKASETRAAKTPAAKTAAAKTPAAKAPVARASKATAAKKTTATAAVKATPAKRATNTTAPATKRVSAATKATAR